MDVWGLGAIFGELLQRIEYLGQASVPYLKVLRQDVWGLGAIFGELLQRIEYLGQASVLKVCSTPQGTQYTSRYAVHLKVRSTLVAVMVQSPRTPHWLQGGGPQRLTATLSLDRPKTCPPQSPPLVCGVQVSHLPGVFSHHSVHPLPLSLHTHSGRPGVRHHQRRLPAHPDRGGVVRHGRSRRQPGHTPRAGDNLRGDRHAAVDEHRDGADGGVEAVPAGCAGEVSREAECRWGGTGGGAPAVGEH